MHVQNVQICANLSYLTCLTGVISANMIRWPNVGLMWPTVLDVGPIVNLG